MATEATKFMQLLFDNSLEPPSFDHPELSGSELQTQGVHESGSG